MKKIYLVLCFVFITLLAACSNSNKKVTIDGVEYDSKLIDSGYYLDKTNVADEDFVAALEKTKVIERPSTLGEVTLPDISTIEITERKPETITDEMVEAEIEKERDTESSYTEVKQNRQAKLGDKVTIDFKGYVDGEVLEGGEASDYELVLGSNSFIPGFEDQVAGHSAGKKFSINVEFPEDYGATELAGKPAKFDVTIKTISELVTPEVDEEFVKKHTTTGATNVEDYKKEVRQRLADRAVYEAERESLDELAEKLIDTTKFNPTEEALAWEFSTIIDSYKTQAKQYGVDLETMLTAQGNSAKDEYEVIKSQVPSAIQMEMLFDELEKKYNVTVTDDDLQNWFKQMADYMGYGNQITYEEYEEYVGKEAIQKTVKRMKILGETLKDCKKVEAKEEDNNESFN